MSWRWTDEKQLSGDWAAMLMSADQRDMCWDIKLGSKENSRCCSFIKIQFSRIRAFASISCLSSALSEAFDAYENTRGRALGRRHVSTCVFDYTEAAVQK